MTDPKAGYSWLANLSGARKVKLAILPLLVLSLAYSLVTLRELQQQELDGNRITQTYQVLLELQQAQQAVQASQLGLRSFLLDQRSADLQSVRDGKRELARHLDRLQDLVADDPAQLARASRAQDLAARWQREVGDQMIAPLSAIAQGEPAVRRAQAQKIREDYLARRTAPVADVTAALAGLEEAEQDLLVQRRQQSLAQMHQLRVLSALFATAFMLFCLYVLRMAYLSVIRPLRQTTDLMTRLAARDHSVVITRLGRADEIGEIARAMEVFKRMMLDADDRSWAKSQLSALSQRLQQATTHREFGESLTSHLAPLVNAGVALYYIYDPNSERLDLLGSYGLRQSWDPAQMYVPGEGLVGQCVLERKPIELDQAPAPYLHIHSASGEASPSAIVILPVIYRGQVTGVLELAGFAAPSALQRQLLDDLLPLVALTQENLTRAINTQELLERTREQADELLRSKEALQQQQQGLRDSNAALHAKTRQLEEQSQRLTVSEEELRVQAEELQASNEELRDKTASLDLQRQVLEDLQLDTEQKAAELARASQYKSDFLANMSHELRTPLNSLLILSRSLADNDTGNLDDEQIESARIIHDAGSNLLRLINDILDLSKIEAGKMELVIDTLPLADFERTLRRTFAHVAEEKRLAFEVIIDPSLPTALHTDGARLEQVANNLIGNAFKFTSQGGVTVRIGRPDPSRPLPETMAGLLLVAISVTDTGIGIPQDKFQRIFHAFEQVDASTSRQYGGTGLGLAICRRIAALLGGDITLHSEPGKGSTFTVLIPEQAPATPPASAEGAAAGATEAPSRSHLPGLLPESIGDDRLQLEQGATTILVIEDDPAFARILADMIHRKGYRVLAAADGESGLALARSHRPTGIILDVMLPGMDGWTVLERLKADEATRHLPVHFISATEDANRGRELGAVGFLTKPVSREQIGGAFDRLLHFAEGHTRHLLIVDDDADSRTAVRTMLRRDNVLIEEAGSAEEALRMTTRTDFDCIVLDLGLPGMSGVELLEHLSAAPGGVPPVVIYSGRDLSSEENLKLRQYTDSIVVKGARSPERLLDEVSLFLHSIQHAPGRAREQPASSGELEGRSVLLVDDDMRNLFALSRVLRGWGMTVTMAQDGHKALKALADNPGMELALMDIMMPGMDGYETIRQIRAQPGLATLPVIALTAKAMRGDREKCLEAGASDYLSKPVDIDKLASLMRVWLPRRSTA